MADRPTKTRVVKRPKNSPKKQAEPRDTDQQFFDENGDPIPGISSEGQVPLPPGLDDDYEVIQEEDPDAANMAALLDQKDEADAAADEARRTNLHKLVAQMWGNDDIADYLVARISQFADPDSAKKTKHGFKIDLNGGGNVEWAIVQERGEPPHEAIRGQKHGFKQEDAEAMVALARIHGWNSIKVHGKEKHKEKIWLAVQHENFFEERAFRMGQLAGEIPLDQTFRPLTITNFRPGEDSKVYKQWLEEKAALEAQFPLPELPLQADANDPEAPAVTSDMAPAPTPESTPAEDETPDTAAPEGETPVQGKPAEPAEKAPKQHPVADAAKRAVNKRKQKSAEKKAAKETAKAEQNNGDAGAADQKAAEKKAPEAKAPETKAETAVPASTAPEAPAATKPAAPTSKTPETKAPKAATPKTAAPATPAAPKAHDVKDAAFEAQHPRDEHGHFVKKEEPKAGAPAAEKPAAEKPAAEKPAAEKPKAAAPKEAAPKQTAPKTAQTGGSKFVVPAKEAPTAATPKAHEPKAQAPKAHENKGHAAKAPETKGHETKAPAQTAAAPKKDAPKHEAPKHAAPKQEAPKAAGGSKFVGPQGSHKKDAPKAADPKQGQHDPKNAVFEKQHPRDEHGHFVKKEEPKAAAPKTHAPKAPEQKAPAAKTAGHKTQAPAEAKKEPAHKAPEAKAATPHKTTPKAEAPKAAAPKKEAPKHEAPKHAAPKASGPAGGTKGPAAKAPEKKASERTPSRIAKGGASLTQSFNDQSKKTKAPAHKGPAHGGPAHDGSATKGPAHKGHAGNLPDKHHDVHARNTAPNRNRNNQPPRMGHH